VNPISKNSLAAWLAVVALGWLGGCGGGPVPTFPVEGEMRLDGDPIGDRIACSSRTDRPRMAKSTVLEGWSTKTAVTGSQRSRQAMVLRPARTGLPWWSRAAFQACTKDPTNRSRQLVGWCRFGMLRSILRNWRLRSCRRPISSTSTWSARRDSWVSQALVRPRPR